MAWPTLSLKAITAAVGALFRNYKGTVADQAAMLALVAKKGDWCKRTDTGSAYELTANDATVLANWQIYPGGGGGGGGGDLLAANNLSDVANATTSRTNLGLGNVNNTSDANKPVSSAQQAALDGKSATGHSHSGFVPTGGTAGQALKKIDGAAYNYSWQDDSTGSGGTAASQIEAEAGAENTKFMTSLRSAQAITARVGAVQLTGYTLGASTAILASDTQLVAFGKTQAQINAKADLLTPFAETGTAFTIANATHARDGTASNAAAIAATFNFTGMPIGASGAIKQLGAGVVTLQATDSSAAAVTYSYAPGVTASPTTAGVGGIICWYYLGSNAVLIEFRSQAAAGGSSNNRAIADATTYTLVDNTVDNVVTTLTLGTIGVGTLIEIDYHIDQATAGANGDAILSWDLGTTQITFQATPAASASTGKVARCTMFVKALTGADNVYASWPLLLDGSNATDPVQKATVTLTGTVTLRLRAQKAAGGVGRAMRIQMINVNVRQP